MIHNHSNFSLNQNMSGAVKTPLVSLISFVNYIVWTSDREVRKDCSIWGYEPSMLENSLG